MATLTNKKIKDTYKSLLKVSDNGNLEAALKEISDGEGNASGVQLNTAGDLTASGTVAFGSLKDSGENITISKFVDEADGIASNDNDTTIPTSAAVKNYVDTKVTAEDLDFGGDSGTGSVDLDSQTFTIAGTANEVVTSASGQTLTVGLPSTINVDVQGDLTGNVTGNVSGNVTGNVTGNVSGDLTGNVTATSVLANGVTATTQASSDNSTKVATTAFVKSVVTAEDLDFAGDSGTGAVDLDSQTLSIVGTANEIVTSASGQTLTVGLPSSITVNVTGNLTGNVSGNVTGDVTGNADTATALETSRTIALSGDVVGSGSFDGSANLTLSTTIQPNSVALGTDTTGDYVSNLGAGTGVTIANNTGEGSNPTIAVNYGSTANTSVEGDTLVTIQGTTNEIEVSGGAVTLGAGGTVTVGLPDNVIIAGDLTVNGTTTTINTQTLSVEDPLIELANQNASNSVDTGFFANYSLDAGVTTKYAGLFKDSSDSDKFKLFKGLEVEPATTVDVAGTGYTKGDLVVNDLDAVTISGTLSTAAQPNITSVGTLSSLTVGGALNATISTAAQPNITSVGTLSSLAVSGDLTVDTNTLYVDSANNRVGVNTLSPETEMDVLGTLTVQSSAANIILKDTGAADNEDWRIVANGGPLQIQSRTNAGVNTSRILFDNNGDISFFEDTGSSVKLFWDASAESLGIGTSSPASLLHIQSNSSPTLTLDHTEKATWGVGDVIGKIDYYTSDASGNAPYSTAFIQSENETGAGTLPSGALVFGTATYNAVGGAVERLRIDSSGRVGIGTSSPSNELTIESASGATRATLINTNNAVGGAGVFLSVKNGGTQVSSATLKTDNAGNFSVFTGTTSESEKLRIDSSGRVGIGTSNLNAKLNIDNGYYLRTNSTNTTQENILLQGAGYYIGSSLYGNVSIRSAYDHTSNYGDLRFYVGTGATNTSEAMRIDRSGNVGIGTISATDRLSVYTTTDYGNNSTYADATIGLGNVVYPVSIRSYRYGGSYLNGMDFYYNNGTPQLGMRIDSSGVVQVRNETPTIQLYNTDTSVAAAQELGSIDFYTSDISAARVSSYVKSIFDSAFGASYLTFGTSTGVSAPTEKLRIDSSGNVGIGGSPTEKLHIIGATDSTIRIQRTGVHELQLKSDGTVLAASANLSLTSTNSVLINAGGTERAQITSGGYLKASNNGSYIGSTGLYHEFNTNDSSNATFIAYGNNGSYGGAGLQSRINRTSSGGNYSFFSAYDSAGAITRFVVHDDGDVENVNNSYGAISDVKLKENIVDASPKLDDLLKVKIRSYNLIDSGLKQIGVVAQELEEIFPSMVNEKPDFEEREVVDEEGNVTIERVDLGTTTKSVKYSVFVPMLIKAMQEQQEIINDLKARIEILENK